MRKSFNVAAPERARGGSNRKVPNLPRWLFWETNVDTLDWKGAYRSVIEKILEFGQDADLEELIRFYGRRKVISTLKKGHIYLMDESIARACAYFKLKPEELWCYVRKQSQSRHWL